jgi:hypothetical protein
MTGPVDTDRYMSELSGIKRAVTRLIRAELAWFEAQQGSQKPEHRELLNELNRARSIYRRSLETVARRIGERIERS